MGKRLSALFCFGEDHKLLGITGTLQVEDGVVHIVAEKLWRPTLELKPSGQPPGIFIESNSLHKPPAFFPRAIDMIGVV